MAQSYLGIGAVASGAAAGTPALPASAAVGPPRTCMIAFVENANESQPFQAGWTPLDSPTGIGTPAAAGATRLSAFWRLFESGDTAPSTGDSGDHQVCQIVGINGNWGSHPIGGFARSQAASATTAFSAPSVTTTAASQIVVSAVGRDTDATTNTLGTLTNANLTSLNKRGDNGTTAGQGGGLVILTGVKSTAGATGNTTATFGTATIQDVLTLFLVEGQGIGDGVTVGASVGLIAGSATGGGGSDATATGVTVSSEASLVAGAASAVRNPTQAGATLTPTVSLIAGTATGGAAAAGAVVAPAASLVTGAASGGATSAGVTLAPSASLVSGTASGGTVAAGQTLAPQASLIAGAASGVRNAAPAGVTVAASASVIGGAATGAATASGQTLSAAAALVPGTADAGTVAGGAVVSPAASLIAGTAIGSATAAGQIYLLSALLDAGAASESGDTRQYPLAGVPQAWPLTAVQEFPAPPAVEYPAAGQAQEFPLQGQQQTYPLG